jgi:hypothetical protein
MQLMIRRHVKKFIYRQYTMPHLGVSLVPPGSLRQSCMRAQFAWRLTGGSGQVPYSPACYFTRFRDRRLLLFGPRSAPPAWFLTSARITSGRACFSENCLGNCQCPGVACLIRTHIRLITHGKAQTALLQHHFRPILWATAAGALPRQHAVPSRFRSRRPAQDAARGPRRPGSLSYAWRLPFPQDAHTRSTGRSMDHHGPLLALFRGGARDMPQRDGPCGPSNPGLRQLYRLISLEEFSALFSNVQ